MGIASELIYGAEVPVPRRGSTAELNAIYMLSPQEGWAVGTSVSTREQGRAAPQGGYFPTTLPVLLQYRQGAWSVVVS
jgi:hypothetical protein